MVVKKVKKVKVPKVKVPKVPKVPTGKKLVCFAPFLLVTLGVFNYS